MLRFAFLLRCLYQGPTAAFAFMQQDMLEELRRSENFLRFEKAAIGEAFLLVRVIHAVEDAKTVGDLVKAERLWRAI